MRQELSGPFPFHSQYSPNPKDKVDNITDNLDNWVSLLVASDLFQLSRLKCVHDFLHIMALKKQTAPQKNYAEPISWPIGQYA